MFILLKNIIFQKLLKLEKSSRLATLTVIILISIYTTVFSYYTILKHFTFQSFAWDLGIFQQALYTTAFYGRLLYYTVENYVNPTGSFFAIHFSPILFILLPIFAIYPRPETLLVLQSLFLALGALPLYLIAQEVLKKRIISITVVIVYLLYPALQGGNWFDFHTEAFVPVMVLSLFYFFIKERLIPFIVFLVLTLSIGEYAPLIVFILFTNILLVRVYHRHSNDFLGKKLRFSIIAMTVSSAWFFFAHYIKSLFPLNPDFEKFLLATKHWEVLGIDENSNPYFSVPLRIITDPLATFRALYFDYHLKFFYLILLLGPLLFYPLHSRYFLSTLAILLFFLTSNFKPYYMIGSQYPLTVIPTIFIAFIYALRDRYINIVKTLVVVSLLFSLSTSPISPLSSVYVKASSFLWYPASDLSVNDRVIALHEMLRLIPPNSSILTQNYIFPHIANRIEAFVIPQSIGWGPWYFNYEKMQEYLSLLINRSEYILLELPLASPEEKYVFDKVSQINEFGIYAIATSESSEIIMFKKGYAGPPKILLNKPRVFDLRNGFIIASGIVAYDDVYGKVAYHQNTSSSEIFIYGPYITMLPGTYKINFLVKVQAYNTDHVAIIDVANNYGKEILGSKDVLTSEIKLGEWQNITLIIHVDSIKRTVEFRIIAMPNVEIYFAKVTVERLLAEVVT